jgi:hypothetical protein
MMSAREEENAKALEQHQAECQASNAAHLIEMENKRIAEAAYVDTKFAEFWERKKNNSQKLRDKAQQ